jgi:hypothetical protein
MRLGLSLLFAQFAVKAFFLIRVNPCHPWLKILDSLPSLQHDPARPEDVLKTDPDDDGIGGDDAADAARYLIATKPRTIKVRKFRGL